MNPNHIDQDEGFDPDDVDENGYRRPSKSMLKRESHDLQTLGKQMLELPDSYLKDLNMPDRLSDALQTYKKTKSFEGRRRQLQFIGKVMREVDPAPYREAVAAFQLGHARNALALHQAAQAQHLQRFGDPARVRAAQVPEQAIDVLRLGGTGPQDGSVEFG